MYYLRKACYNGWSIRITGIKEEIRKVRGRLEVNFQIYLDDAVNVSEEGSMANIIKKIKKKRKKQKILAQRAKLAKSQEKAQSANTQEDYEARLARHKRKNIRRTVLILGGIVVAVAAVLLFLEKRSYGNYRILRTSEQEMWFLPNI